MTHDEFLRRLEALLREFDETDGEEPLDDEEQNDG